MGRRVVSATDMTLVRTPNKSYLPCPTFPNGKSTTFSGIPGKFYSTYVIITAKGNVSYDGERIAQFVGESFFAPKTGKIMAAIMAYPEPDRPPASSPIEPPNTNMPRKTLLQKNNEVIAYRNFIDNYEAGDPADEAEAALWLATARSGTHVFYTEYAPGKFGKTSYDCSSLTMQDILADVERVKTDPTVNLSMHNF